MTQILQKHQDLDRIMLAIDWSKKFEELRLMGLRPLQPQFVNECSKGFVGDAGSAWNAKGFLQARFDVFWVDFPANQFLNDNNQR
eukprot:CAMPEP_0113852132 /NCGR_PEP_ID=MMETSP0372-20130328/5238_1 /TAXON_ID=340204 /ORGANISM="Lankesteria abbotti" /LENGTH=84 /DNA_ID=CAMNT_0000823443 /DNA_START=37 /DNA_END=287 /DNA_ORIENTATION=- /assembly_acc=CAM_ASM_000359